MSGLLQVVPPGLLHAHSGLRWILLIALIATVVNAGMKWKAKGDFKAMDKILAIVTLASAHTIALIGFVVYFKSPMPAASNFFAFIHPLAMLLAVVLITVGYSRAKKADKSRAKFRKLMIWYGIGLALIIASIPWPFIFPGSGWA